MSTDPESAKINLCCQTFCTFLGSALAKAARETLMKLTAVVNFINILHAHFSYKILVPKISKPNITKEKLLNILLYKKACVKC